MLDLLKRDAGTLCDRLSRRKLLEVGGLGVVGLSLSGLLRAEASTPAVERGSRRARARARSCIILFLNGGPSHLDM
jgi:hypothetical protein